ncbi:MAG: hypothetical protein Q7R58_01070 [bacterium]|nr:hypothetical protein [bacterium]
MKSSTTHLIIWIIISVATVIGQGFWYSVITKKSAEVADLQNQIDTRTETANRIELARTALAEIAGNESAVQSYFVPETSVVSFINNLESRAREQTATMKVRSVSAGGSAAQPTLILAITVSGTFDAVMRTIGAVEYAPYNVVVSKLSLMNERKNMWGANLELTVGSVPASTTAGTKESAQKVISFYAP